MFELLLQRFLAIMPEVSCLLVIVAMPVSPLGTVSQIYCCLLELGVEGQLWIYLIQVVRVVIINVW